MNDILLKSFNFHEIIDMLVDFERNNQSCSLKELSAILNLDEGHVRKMNAPSVNRHYTFEQLYILSRVWNVDFNVFLPSLETLSQLTAFQQYSEVEIKEFIDNLILNMKGNNYNVWFWHYTTSFRGFFGN